MYCDTSITAEGLMGASHGPSDVPIFVGATVFAAVVCVGGIFMRKLLTKRPSTLLSAEASELSDDAEQ
jgi:hypothetical protein